MKLFTRILLLVITTSLVFNVVVVACEERRKIVLQEKETEADKEDLAPDFPMVTSLIRF